MSDNEDKALNFLKIGNAYLETGELDLAIENFNQVIAWNPDALAYYSRGLAYFKKGEFDLAIEDFAQVITFKHDYPGALYSQGLAYFEKGELDLAIENFTQAIASNPDASAYYSRGLAYFEKGEFDLAIEDFTQAIRFKPKYDNAFYKRGLAYFEKGEFDLAIKDYSEAIESNPKLAAAFNNRGIAYRKIGKEEEAIQGFQEANKLDPTVISKKQIEEIKKATKEVQNFQSILKKLRDEYEDGEKYWFRASILSVIVVFAGLLLQAICLELDYKTYPLYVFSSIITFIVIRQYTNAKQLRIEASNRLAMAKMFEKIKQTKDNPHYQGFTPKIIDSIAYSMYKNHEGSTVQISEALKAIKAIFKNKS